MEMAQNEHRTSGKGIHVGKIKAMKRNSEESTAVK